MTTSGTIILPVSSPVQHGACPICHRAALRYSIGTHHLHCAACAWAVDLFPAEHKDFLFAQLFPEGLQLAGFLAEVARRTATVPAPPEWRLIGEHGADGSYKHRVVPTGPESGADRLARLAEQAALNEVQIRPDPRRPGGYLATSQRHDAAGQPVAIYPLWQRGDDWRCGCAHEGPCAHLAALATYLHAAQPAPVFGAGVREVPPAEVQARAKAAISDLWGDD